LERQVLLNRFCALQLDNGIEFGVPSIRLHKLKHVNDQIVVARRVNIRLAVASTTLFENGKKAPLTCVFGQRANDLSQQSNVIPRLDYRASTSILCGSMEKQRTAGANLVHQGHFLTLTGHLHRNQGA
jgi:hypothetical protein